MINSVKGRSVARNSQCFSPKAEKAATTMVSPKIRRTILSPQKLNTQKLNSYTKVTSYGSQNFESVETTNDSSRVDKNLKAMEKFNLSKEWTHVFNSY